MEYLLKINRLGSKALIFGVALGDDKTASFEVKAQDYVSEGTLKGSDLKMQDIFISPGRMADLSSVFRLHIIQKVAPGIRKDGYDHIHSTTPSLRLLGDQYRLETLRRQDSKMSTRCNIHPEAHQVG
jgi:hypothetical protein